MEEMMSRPHWTQFSTYLLREVVAIVRAAQPDIKVSDASVYIEQSDGSSRSRWATFKFGDFYWEGYADNIYDAKAKAWTRWLEKHHPELAKVETQE